MVSLRLCNVVYTDFMATECNRITMVFFTCFHRILVVQKHISYIFLVVDDCEVFNPSTPEQFWLIFLELTQMMQTLKFPAHRQMMYDESMPQLSRRNLYWVLCNQNFCLFLMNVTTPLLIFLIVCVCFFL